MQLYTIGVIQDAINLYISSEVVPVNYKHNDRFCKAFGRHLRKIREGKGISMREFAIQADMEYSQLSKIERGVINTTISSVYALSDALDIPVKDLFDFKFPSKET